LTTKSSTCNLDRASTVQGSWKKKEDLKVIGVDSMRPCKTFSRHKVRSLRARSPLWLGLFVISCGFPSSAASQQAPVSAAPDARASVTQQLPDQQSAGSIHGTVVDESGAPIGGAHVTVTRDDQSPAQELRSDEDGQFSIDNLPPGPFHIAIAADGFAGQSLSGVLHPGEVYTGPPIQLAVATSVTEVQVVAPRSEVAEAEVKAEEKQRVLAVIPNFYVSYDPDAAPLNSRQKFELAWKTTIDPVTFVLTGGIAGIQQAQNHFRGYGQGAQGYAKRFGASYADTITGTFIGSAILPSLLKQDPRYFYKGTGGTRARILYAIVNSVITKGDNKRWQPNYSGIIGGLAASGISNLYYPPQDRNGAQLTFENALIGLGTTAASNLFQEFLVRKLTPNLPHRDPAKT
jgi:Carboxypeptidase regulatory-like domain